MKRLLAAAITVLAFLAGLLVQGGLAAPDIENLTDAVCTGADGMVYTCLLYTSWIISNYPSSTMSFLVER